MGSQGYGPRAAGRSARPELPRRRERRERILRRGTPGSATCRVGARALRTGLAWPPAGTAPAALSEGSGGVPADRARQGATGPHRHIGVCVPRRTLLIQRCTKSHGERRVASIRNEGKTGGRAAEPPVYPTAVLPAKLGYLLDNFRLRLGKWGSRGVAGRTWYRPTRSISRPRASPSGPRGRGADPIPTFLM